MFKNYLKIAFRNLSKNKTYSFVNILGLSVGIAVTIFIMVWVEHQLNYDGFHKNGKRIYQVYRRDKTQNPSEGSEITSGLAANDLKSEFPEIENAGYFKHGKKRRF